MELATFPLLPMSGPCRREPRSIQYGCDHRFRIHGLQLGPDMLPETWQ